MSKRRSTESSGPRPGRRQRPAAIRMFGALGVLVGMAMVLAPGAFAAAPEAPETKAATDVLYTTASVSGVLNPGGVGSVGEYRFTYGTGGSCTEKETEWTVALGTKKEAVGPVELTGLQPNTQYTFCLVERNAEYEEASSAEPYRTFTTKAVAEPTVTIASVSTFAATTAHFSGTVDPNAPGAAPQNAAFNTSWHFECTPECPGLTGGEVPADNKAHEVSVDASGLLPHTAYEVRLVAANAGGQVVAGPVAFTTLVAAPTIANESVVEVTGTSAKLEAEIDPGGGATTYRVEYGTGSVSEASTAESSSIGSDNAEHRVSASIDGLRPGTVYRYEVIATNSASGAEGTPGQELTLTAQPVQPSGSSFALLDGRQWEMVSPADKHGSGIEGMTYGGGDIQAAEAGGAITYYANGPVVSDPEGNTAVENSQVLSTRTAGGVWSTQDVVTPRRGTSDIPEGLGSEYRLFSSELSSAVLEPVGETSLPAPSDGPVQEQTLYMRDGLSGGYQALVSEANVVEGARFGELDGDENRIEFEGASPSLEHVVFGSNERLTGEEPGVEPAGGVGDNNANLYEWNGAPGQVGAVQLVSGLPHGEFSSSKSVGVGDLQRHLARDAVSGDGSRVIWTGGEEQGLYVTDMEKHESIRVDPAGEPGGPRFQGANAEGTRIFFLDTARLVTGADEGVGGGEGDLYVYEVPRTGGHLEGTLHDLTLDTHELGGGKENGSVRGMLIGYGGEGSGEGESSSVYFVDRGVLASNKGAAGREATSEGDNLYVERFDDGGWQAPRFIATLSSEDAPTWAEHPGGGEGENLARLTAGVSSSGDFLSFMSSEALTGFDSRDASSGASDEEVFLYDAQSGKLVCASCNPFGVRPHGVLDPRTSNEHSLLVEEPHAWAGHWLAGSVPGWTADINYEEALYQSRFLASSGRLFFDSSDALVPADGNGREDVYEYEPEGVGSCARGVDSRDIVFREEDGAGGCVGLISSGASNEESAFLDASARGPGGEAGEDVFFLTNAQLVAKDTDSAFDVYDAHECPSSASCVEGSVSVPPACSETESCRAAPAAQPAVFGLPSSATFSGPGNPASPAPATAVKAKRLTRAQQLTRALKTCRRKPKRKRAGCEAQARRKYGPIHKTKTKHETNTKSGGKK